MTDAPSLPAPTATAATSPAAGAAAAGAPPPWPVPGPAVPRVPPRRAALVAVALGAAGTDLALWTTGPGLAWTLGATAAALAVLIGARPTRPASLVLLAAVPLLAVWCTFRTSAWLIGPDVVAINVCLLLGADLARRGWWWDQSFGRIVSRFVMFAEDAVLAGQWIRPALGRRSLAGDAAARRDWKPVIAGLLVGLPVVGALLALLASADAVFASFFDVGLEPSVVIRHVIFVIGGAWAVTALLRRAAATADLPLGAASSIPATVGNVVLSGVAAVFALFAASRLLALTGMAERIATTRGLTWAEYARSGFFQLLAVAAITLVVLLVVCGYGDRGSESQARLRKVLGLVIVVEIVGIVADAVHRLGGYEAAYGLTMLRLYSTWFALWLGVVFLVVGVALATDYRGRRWLSPTLLATALGGLLLVNVVDPAAVVAERNLTGATRAGETDFSYLGGSLGDDALPVIAEHLDDLDARARQALLESMCWDERTSPQWFNPNTARSAADELVAQWCPADA